MTDKLRAAVVTRITGYLLTGGLFNPELASHNTVRDLLIDAREALAEPEKEPVAWMACVDGITQLTDKLSNFGPVDKRYAVPLYTHPKEPT